MDRAKMGNPPQWYQHKPIPQVPFTVNDIPFVFFGGQPANTVSVGSPGDPVPNSYRNPVYTVTNNISKVWSTHNFKTGIAVERTDATDPAGGAYRGVMDFSRDVNNPFDTGNSYSNALAGVLLSYSETDKILHNQKRIAQL